MRKNFQVVFLTNFSSTQLMLAPVSGRAHSVDSLLKSFFLIITLKFTKGVGQHDIAAYASGLDIKHFVFLCTAFTLKYSFFLLLFLTKP